MTVANYAIPNEIMKYRMADTLLNLSEMCVPDGQDRGNKICITFEFEAPLRDLSSAGNQEQVSWFSISINNNNGSVSGDVRIIRNEVDYFGGRK